MNLRKLLAEATPGPWEADDTSDQFEDDMPPTGWFRRGPGNVDVGDYMTLSYADANLIVALHNAAPLLLDVVDAARPYAEYVEGFSTETGLPSLKAALARLDSEPLP